MVLLPFGFDAQSPRLEGSNATTHSNSTSEGTSPCVCPSKETRASDPAKLILPPDFHVVREAAPEAAEPESAAPAAEPAQEAPRRIVLTRPRRAMLHLTERLNCAQLGEGEAEEDLRVLPRSARNRSVYDILAEFRRRRSRLGGDDRLAQGTDRGA